VQSARTNEIGNVIVAHVTLKGTEVGPGDDLVDVDAARSHLPLPTIYFCSAPVDSPLRMIHARLRGALDIYSDHTSTMATFCAASQLATLAQ
jgi:hypothetical protein